MARLTKLNLKGGLVNNSGQNLVGAGELFTTGKVWYVDSVNGSDGNLGDDPNFPKATLDSAVTAAVANRGDVIVLMPNHAQHIANATTFQLDKAGLTVIGLGDGRNRPTFSFTNTAGSVELDSADCRISNIVFVADVSAVVVGVNVDNSDVTIDNCEFNFNDSGDDFIDFIVVDGVRRTNLVDNVFIAQENVVALGASRTAIYFNNVDELVIQGNLFTGGYTSAVIGDPLGAPGGGESDNLFIIGNVINNDAPNTTALAIDINSTASGMIANNRIFMVGGHTTDAGFLDPGSCGTAENYATTAVDRSGHLAPVSTQG